MYLKLYTCNPPIRLLPTGHSCHTEITKVISREKFPTLAGWIGRMKKLPAVQAVLFSYEVHAAFIKSIIAGKHDYSSADLTGQGVTIYTKKEE